MNRATKLRMLADYEGYDDPLEMMESAMWDGCSPGICTNAGCDYTTNVEPDSDSGWCEECETNTVASCLILGGFI